MKKLVIFFALCLLLTVSVYSQDYKAGIGFRGGLSNGLTIKYFVASDQALEALVAARWGGFHLTGMYEFHHDFFDVSGLYLYYGFGGHYGFWKNDSKYPGGSGDQNHNVIGVNGIAGIEYNFSQIPFNISLDYKPAFNPFNKPKFWLDEFGISVRYVWGNR
jgi:hypothetical protein